MPSFHFFRKQPLAAHVLPALMVLFLFSLAACGGRVGTGEPLVGQEDAPAAQETAGDEKSDTACSYFYYLWGSSAEEEEKYEEAMEAYEKALVCDPAAEHVTRKLAILLVNMGKKEQAIVMIEQLVAAHPSNMDFRVLLANIYTSEGRNNEAKTVYEEILRLRPADSHALLMLGALHARDREYEQAQEMLENLVKQDDRSYAGYSYLAKLYRELRYYDKSIAAYQKALELNWSTMLAYEAVELFEFRGRFEEAAAIYRRLLEEDESNVKVRGRLVRMYLELGRANDALDELRELRDYTENSAMVDLAIGRILLGEKRHDEALALFEKMLKQPENRDLARSMLALTYYELGRKDKAREMLSEVPASSKNYEHAVLMLAQIFVDEEDLERAAILLRNAMQDSASRQPSFYSLLAVILKEQGKPEEGRAIFDQALRDFSGNSKVWYEYGLFLERLGDQAEAMQKMEQVLQLDPDDAYALNYVGYTWADKGINLEKALEYVNKAVRLKPEDGYIRDSLGWVYFKMGNFAAAVRELEAAVGLQADDPTIQEHLGDAYVRTGEIDKALAAYHASLELQADDEGKARLQKRIDSVKDSSPVK